MLFECLISNLNCLHYTVSTYSQTTDIEKQSSAAVLSLIVQHRTLTLVRVVKSPPDRDLSALAFIKKNEEKSGVW